MREDLLVLLEEVARSLGLVSRRTNDMAGPVVVPDGIVFGMPRSWALLGPYSDYTRAHEFLHGVSVGQKMTQYVNKSSLDDEFEKGYNMGM